MKDAISDIRTAIFNRDNNECYYCGAKGQGIKLQLDHILPKSLYNLHGVYNLITSCWGCNFDKCTNTLPDKEYNKIFNYLQKANMIFPLQVIKLYSTRLTKHYTKPKPIKQKMGNITSPAYKAQNKQYLDFISGIARLIEE